MPAKRSRMSGGGFGRGFASKLRSYAMQKARRGMRLTRMAIASRVNVFKRSTEPFGFLAPTTASYAPTEVNVGSSPTQTLTIYNPTASQFVLTNGAQFGGGLQFMLSHLANVSEITSLYDNYRIKKVVVQVLPSFNSADVSQAAGGPMGIPVMHYTVDSDDASATTRIGILENSYCRTVRLDKPFQITLVPRAQNVVNTAAGTNVAGGLLPAGTWLDTASATIPHYGLKFWIDEMVQVASGSASRPFVKFICTYYLECKNVV